MQLAIYLSALIRSVIALHDLINNRIQYGENGIEMEEEKKEETENSKAEGDGKEKGGKDSNKKTDGDGSSSKKEEKK